MKSVDISAAQNIMKMAVNQDTQLNSLLSYYRNKIDDFNKERIQWITKIDQCRYDAELKHKLQWENRKQKDKIEELEKSCSHYKTALYDQRQNYLKLLKQNNDLKNKQNEDSRKIQELLNICQPIQEDMVMCKDIRPQISNKFIVNQLNIHKNQNHNTINFEKSKNSANTNVNTKNKKNVIKNVYVPNQIKANYQQEILNLKKIQQAQIKNLNDYIQVLKQQLNNLQSRAFNKDDQHTKQYKQLLKNHQDLQKKHASLTAQFFAIRMKLNQNQQQVEEKNELLRGKNIILAQKLREKQIKHQKQQRAIQQLVAKRNNQFKQKYKNDMRKKQQHLNILKQQYQKIQDIYMNKIKSLQQHLTKLNQKYNDLSRKYKRQTINLTNQVKVMQKRVQKQQLQKMRLQMQQLQQQQKKKQQKQDIQQQKKKIQKQQKKLKKTVQIKKAYENKQKVKSKQNNKKTKGIIKKQQIQEQQDQDQQSINTSDIQNIKKHIQELQSKLQLEKIK